MEEVEKIARSKMLHGPGHDPESGPPVLVLKIARFIGRLCAASGRQWRRQGTILCRSKHERGQVGRGGSLHETRRDACPPPANKWANRCPSTSTSTSTYHRAVLPSTGNQSVDVLAVPTLGGHGSEASAVSIEIARMVTREIGRAHV